jgi:transcriptional regulator with XRE-family HTH domain
MPTSLGDFMRITRQRRSLTQDRLADLAGVSRWQVVKMEQGENISIDFLLKVAGALELTEVPVDFVTLRQPDTRALMVAADAIDLARSIIGPVRDSAADLDRAAETIDALLTRPQVPEESQRRIAAAAERLARTSPEHAEEVGRALRETAESSGKRVRPARAEAAARPPARRRAR